MIRSVIDWIDEKKTFVVIIFMTYLAGTLDRISISKSAVHYF